MRKFLMAAGLALAATACSTPADPAAELAALGPMATPTRAIPYMAMAASGDQFEIQSSQMALQMSQNPTVRSMAQMLINDHTRMSAQMVAAAQSARITPPPPQLLPHHAEMLNRLRSASPADFDLMYRQEQLTAHQEALNLHSTYAQQGDVGALRSVAAAAVPIIQGHLAHAQTLPTTTMMQPAAPQPAYVPPPVYRSGERG